MACPAHLGGSTRRSVTGLSVGSFTFLYAGSDWGVEHHSGSGSGHMNDTAIPINRLIAYTFWGLAALTLLAAWLVALTASPLVGGMLGITALCFIGVAGVSQIRCYVVRLCALLRAYNRAELDRRSADLHSVR